MLPGCHHLTPTTETTDTRACRWLDLNANSCWFIIITTNQTHVACRIHPGTLKWTECFSQCFGSELYELLDLFLMSSMGFWRGKAMYVCLGFVVFFFFWPSKLQGHLSEFFQINLESNFIAKDEKWPEKCSLCLSPWGMTGVDICSQIGTKTFFSISRDRALLLSETVLEVFCLSSILQLSSLHLCPFPCTTGQFFQKQVPCLVCKGRPETLFSEREKGAFGRPAETGETKNACTQTRLQPFCSRVLLTNPTPPHLLSFPPAFPQLNGREGIAEQGGKRLPGVAAS